MLGEWDYGLRSVLCTAVHAWLACAPPSVSCGVAAVAAGRRGHVSAVLVKVLGASCLDVVGVVLDLVLARAVVVAVGVFDGVVLVQCCTGGQLFSGVVVIVVAFGPGGRFFVLVNLWVDLGRVDSRCCCGVWWSRVCGDAPRLGW